MKAKQKGSSFERQVAAIIRCLFPNVATSRLMNRDADNRGVDLVHTPGYAFQCKRFGRRYPNLEQVISEMDTNDKKIVVHKRDRKMILATMDLATLIQILNELKAT